MTDGIDVRRLGTAAFELAESPVWLPDSGSLGFVDILAGAIHLWRVAEGAADDSSELSEVSTIELGMPVGAVAPGSGPELVAAVADGFVCVDHSAEPAITWLNDVTAGLEDQRMNDGKCDPQGAFVAGTTSWTGREDEAALYRLERSGASRVLMTGLSNSNGLCWSSDGQTMFHIDTPRRTVSVWGYDPHGPLTGPLRTIDLSAYSGLPDGMTIDADGNLWIAFWGGSCVRAIDASGTLLAEVPLPAEQPTSCAFGGPDLGTLFITSANYGIGEAAGASASRPADGGIYQCRPGVRGLPVTPWAATGTR